MKNKLCILSILISFLFCGCDDFLDKPPLGQFVDEDYWKTEGDLRAFAFGYYASRFSGFGSNDAKQNYYNSQVLNDDFTLTSLPGFAPQPSLENGAWSGAFSNIRKDNTFVERASTLTFDPETNNHWLGIARFFRAMDYSNFVFAFGDVPYYDKRLTSISPKEELFRPRDPLTFVMDKVVEDYKFAAANVKIEDLTTGPKGLVITRDVVDAFMSRQLLAVGTQIKYNPRSTDEDKQKAGVYLQEAKDAAWRVISSGRYKLASNYQKLCSTVDITSTDVKDEMILFRIYATGVLTHSIMTRNSLTAIQGDAVPKDVMDTYLCTNGLPINPVGGANAKYMGDKTIEEQTANRDGRLAATFRTDKYYLVDKETGYSKSGYKCYKFLDEATATTPEAIGSANITDAPVIRLGEVMLNYIEAAAELADMGLYTVVQNDVDKTINALRKRAGYGVKVADMQIVGGLPAVGGTVYDDADRDPSVPSFIWEVRRERRIELLYEGFRLDDLKRWRKITYCNTELYPKKNLGAWVTKDATTKSLILVDINNNVISKAGETSGSGYIQVSQSVRNAEIGKVLDRAYLDCVPTYEIGFYKRNGSILTQNPDWPTK